MYGKIFASMFKGSLYGQWEAIVTFTVMIVLADQHGDVDMTPEALSAQTSIPLEIIRRGIADLEQPDPESRTPDEEGRRIVRVSDSRNWGWHITNYEHYRQMRSLEERREYMRQYQRSRRSARRATRSVSEVNTASTPVNNVTQAVSSKQRQRKETATTWLTPYLNAWEAKYGKGSAATVSGRLAKALKPLHDAHGPERVLGQLAIYLSQTEAQYASPQAFAQKFEGWGRGGGKFGKELDVLSDFVARGNDGQP